VYIFACLMLWFFAWLSDHLKKRTLVVMIAPVPILLGMEAVARLNAG
jgi:uncharacterized membrane protein